MDEKKSEKGSRKPTQKREQTGNKTPQKTKSPINTKQAATGSKKKPVQKKEKTESPVVAAARKIVKRTDNRRADGKKSPVKSVTTTDVGGQKIGGAPALRIIPLGGINEIGKNMTVFEYGDEIIIVDCGMTFPDNELLGVDLVIPDTTYLINNKHKVKAIFLTHGHEDHIGALPYVLRDLNVPIYCTALTAGILNMKISEHKNLTKVKINVKKPGDRIRVGSFEVELVHVNHSIADSLSLAIRTPVGLIVMSGDFKIDSTPVDGPMIDLERFGRLGREGVLLLMVDSTNAERPGLSTSERKVGASFENHFSGTDKRIIVATFASNVHRIQQIIDVAVKYGRKVAVSGRSLDNIMKVGMELGYIRPPDDTLIDLKDINKYPPSKLCVITTGSQGETMSALYRMAFSGHKQVEVGPNDKILIAATPIPGNEKPVYAMINELFKRGAEVVYEKLAEIHVSGHACQEEIKILISLLKPKYYMPVHGEFRHLKVNGSLGVQCGVAPENILISDLGKVLEINKRGVKWAGNVTAGQILVDGYGVGDVGSAVLKERRHLGQDGVIVAQVTLDIKRKVMIGKPQIFTRGFIFVREAEEIMREMEKTASDSVQNCFTRNVTSRNQVRDYMISKLSEYLHKKTKRDPMIIPVIVEV